ncbi:glycosyl hydrolase family 18 protein [Brevibacillus sp. B_LB10_24]|uniref:glycosyl hydrolase family 18 protein n=1 Tax=Brevibacillus sp. B_LB10_24 TaxID=3380645 RepID=UPI0038B88CEF
MLLLFVGLVIFSIFVWLQLPSTERVAPYDGRENVILYHGKAYSQPFQVVDEQILLPFDFIRENMDEYLYWDEPSQSVIVTTKDKVLRMESDKLVVFLNRKPVDLRVGVTEIDGVRYIPFSPLEKLYPFRLEYIESNHVLLVEKAGDAIQQGKISSGKQTEVLRTGPSVKQPIVGEVNNGDEVFILDEEADWYRLQTKDGLTGYMPKGKVSLASIYQVAMPQLEKNAADTAWRPMGKKISMVWEQVVNKTPNAANIGPMPGLQVVSPTWFEVVDEKGTLANKADPAYVKWAHARGYKVWGLVSNGFNPDMTKAFLADFRLREKLIVQILHYANLYDLDGINLDFENVYLDEKEPLVQFVRELTPYLHEQGLTVSMDVTVKSTSERWSMFYDRQALGSVVDYIVIMAYDEHGGSSPVAGSVASFPWTEKGLQGVLEEVPADKVILAVPFYTRLWKETKQADGSVKVTSKALSMSGAENWINEKKLTPQLDEQTGQYFVQYVDKTEGATYKMWLEGEDSLLKRMELIHRYNLAGLAGWRRGLEKDDTWSKIDKNLQRH